MTDEQETRSAVEELYYAFRRWSGAVERALDAYRDAVAFATKAEYEAKLAALEADRARLDWLLNDAILAPNEDGESLCLFLRANDEHEKAFAVVADASGDDPDIGFTAEDVPFLSEEQRAHINGSIPLATGSVNDREAILAAIDVARTPSEVTP